MAGLDPAIYAFFHVNICLNKPSIPKRLHNSGKIDGNTCEPTRSYAYRAARYELLPRIGEIAEADPVATDIEANDPGLI